MHTNGPFCGYLLTPHTNNSVHRERKRKGRQNHEVDVYTASFGSSDCDTHILGRRLNSTVLICPHSNIPRALVKGSVSTKTHLWDMNGSILWMANLLTTKIIIFFSKKVSLNWTTALQPLKVCLVTKSGMWSAMAKKRIHDILAAFESWKMLPLQEG